MIFTREKGVTILEFVLVLAIMSSIVIIGIRQYQLYRNDVYLQQLQYNVNIYMQALSAYYNANCIQNLDYDTQTATTTGTLDPNSTPTPPPTTGAYTITEAQLRAGGFLTMPLFTIPFVSQYVLQFNPSSDPVGTSPAALSPPFQNGNPAYPSGPGSVGKIYFWKPQVAAQISSVALASQYKNQVSAFCQSTLVGSIVTPCESSPAASSFLVWERTPSVSSVTSSWYWPSVPLTKQFKQQFTNDTFYELNNPTWAATHYYLCGG